MSILNVSKRDADRLAEAVHFTEDYRERLKTLFPDSPPGQRHLRSPQPVRGILLQNIYDGKSGAIQLIGRDNVRSAFYIELVGRNPQVTANTFQLQLSGVTLAPDQSIESQTIIGISSPISCTATAPDLADAMTTADRTKLTRSTMTVGLGNPLAAYELQPYGDVIVPESAADPFGYFAGIWYLHIPQELYDFDELHLDPVNVQITGITMIRVQRSFDLLSPDITIATDIDYRTKDYPWQAGTIATCLDFPDVGYGIIRSTSREIEFINVSQ